jgi:hypothetical protein
MFESINFLAVAAATLSSMVLGFLWYTPILFGNQWQKAVGLKDEDMDNAAAMRGHLYTMVGAFIAYTMLSKIIIALNHFGAVKGLMAGLLLSFAFIATTMIGNDTYERRPFSLTFINIGYRMTCFALAGLIIGIWR